MVRSGGMAAAVLLATAALHAVPAAARPPLGPGREAEIESYFAEVGRGESAGWRVTGISVLPDRIRTTLAGPGGAVLALELREPGTAAHPVAHTPSFDIHPVRWEDPGGRAGTPAEAAALVARAVAVRDLGGFQWPDPPARTLGSWALAQYAWQAGLLALVPAILLSAAARSRRDDPAVRRALLEATVLAGAALLLRCLAVEPGPGNLRSHLPVPGVWTAGLPVFGPGFEAWTRIWFAVAGAHEDAVRLAGAAAGALGVLGAWGIGRFGMRSPAAGLAAGIAALFSPVLVRLGGGDDAWGLVAALLAAATALALAAEARGEARWLPAAWLAAALAASTRPEAALGMAGLAAVIAAGPTARYLQWRPAVLIPSALFVAAGALAAADAATQAAAVLPATARPGPLDALGLLGPASVAAPPLTPLGLTLLAAAGLLAAALRTRGRVLLWAAVLLLPALPTAALARPGLLTTARYQLPVALLVAALARIGALRAGRLVAAAWPTLRTPLALLGPVLAATALFLALHPPPLEPTFRLEHAFFRRHLAAVPAGCRILRVTWTGDRGLEVPAYLSQLQGLDHRWIDLPPNGPLARDLPDPADGCLAYWRPAACSAVDPGFRREPDEPLSPCDAVEARYRLEPLAEAWLPARVGFVERYAADPVRVGFYRLR